MSLSSHKRSKNRNKDFEKKRLKVGKQHERSNQTDTTFKAKAILLPQQTISLSKEQEYTSQRNLTAKELLNQLSHYNSNIRKDALIGLRDLFTRHPPAISLYIGTTLEKILPLMTDSDPQPRSALLPLISLILSSVSITQVRPFWPLFMVYLRSAMSHVSEEISLHSMMFFDLWLLHCKELVIQDNKDLLLNFVRLLSKRGVRIQGGNASQKAKGKIGKDGILSRLADLITTLLRSKKEKDEPDTGFKINDISYTSSISFPVSVGFEKFSNPVVFNSLYEGSTSQNGPNITGGDDSSSILSLKTNSLSTKDEILNFAVHSFPQLLNIWVEITGQKEKSETVVATGLNHYGPLLSIAQILRSLWRSYFELYSKEKENEENFAFNRFMGDAQKYIFKSFPLSKVLTGRQSDDINKQIHDINLYLCDIIVIQQCATLTGSSFNSEDENSPTLNNEKKTLLDFLSSCYLETKFDDDILQISKLIIYSPCYTGHERKLLLENLLKSFLKLNEFSTSKYSLFIFLSRAFLSKELPFLILTKENRNNNNDHNDDGQERNNIFLLKDFLQNLPRLLWKLQAKNLKFSERILNFCLQIGQRVSLSESHPTMINGLIPFFHVALRKKDKSGSFKNISMFGPFLKLPLDHQFKVLSLLYSLDTIPEKLFLALAECIISGQIDPKTCSFCFDLLISRIEYNESCESQLPGLFQFFSTSIFGCTRRSLSVESSRSFESTIKKTKLDISSFNDESQHASLESRIEIIDGGLAAVARFGAPKEIFTIFSTTIDELLKTSTIPINVAVSIIHVVSFLNKDCDSKEIDALMATNLANELANIAIIILEFLLCVPIPDHQKTACTKLCLNYFTALGAQLFMEKLVENCASRSNDEIEKTLIVLIFFIEEFGQSFTTSINQTVTNLVSSLKEQYEEHTMYLKLVSALALLNFSPMDV